MNIVVAPSSYISISADYLLLRLRRSSGRLSEFAQDTVSAFNALRFLKCDYVSIVALLPRPEGIGDSRYRFCYKITISHGID